MYVRGEFVSQEMLEKGSDSPVESFWMKIREGRTNSIVVAVCY